MPLITKVKAGSISSLSDARFFAGMGVDWIGFNVDPNSEMYVAPELYKSFVGWIAGPKRVIELSSEIDQQAIEKIIQDYLPEYLEVDFENLAILKTDLPLMVRVNTIDIALDSLPKHVEYLIVDYTNPMMKVKWIKLLASKMPVLLRVPPQVENLADLINDLSIAGIVLEGSPEIQPGIKEYDYSDLLESIEVDA